MSEHDERQHILERPPGLAKEFDRVGGGYDARPGYPDWVFEQLAVRCGLGAGTNVLEIGAGTGQATLPMLDRGARVTAVEPGPALAGRLVERCRGRAVEVVVSAFEEVEVPDAGFDLVAAATSFHWVDTSIGLSKCARALHDEGWLALWWTIWGDPARPDPFHEALQPILRAKAPQLLQEGAGPLAHALDLDARTAEIEHVGAFGAVERLLLPWVGRHEPKALRRVFATFSPWIALPEPLRTELLDDVERLAADDFGGTVVRPYRTQLYLAQRLPRSSPGG